MVDLSDGVQSGYGLGGPGVKPASWRAQVSSFLRLFALQASWNYRTLQGNGFVFAVFPLLRELYAGRDEELEEALRRHTGHFNAHPYLAGLAVGAVARMEAEGRAPEEIRRFKLAVKGPLGSLGDALIWGGWRPVLVLAALVLGLLSQRPVLVVGGFLVAYNVGHLALRLLAFRIGWEHGSQVGEALRRLALPRKAEALAAGGVLLAGVLVGVLAAEGWREGLWGWIALALGGTGIWVGSRVGPRVWRTCLWLLVGTLSSAHLGGLWR